MVDSEITWDADLDWWLNAADANAGLRSAFGGALEAQRVGAVRTPAAWSWQKGDVPEGAQWWRRPRSTDPADRDGEYTDGQIAGFARGRAIYSRWIRLSGPCRAVLVVYYTPRQYYPPGVRGRLGVLAPVALLVAEDRETVVTACQAGPVPDMVRETQDVVNRAHARWWQTRLAGRVAGVAA